MNAYTHSHFHSVRTKQSSLDRSDAPCFWQSLLPPKALTCVHLSCVPPLYAQITILSDPTQQGGVSVRPVHQNVWLDKTAVYGEFQGPQSNGPQGILKKLKCPHKNKNTQTTISAHMAHTSNRSY